MKVLLLYFLAVFIVALWPSAPSVTRRPLVRIGAILVVAMSLTLHRVA